MEYITRLIIRLAVGLFFIPKINLLGIGGETAGIRLDDLALAAIAAYVFCSWLYEGEFKVDRMVYSCFAVVGTFCLSNALNLGHSNILYSVRILEYLVFLWVGQAFAKQGDLSTPLKSLILINCGLIILQAAHIIGAFTTEGYLADVGRSSGLANHPAEMGAWLNLMFAALVFGGTVKFWRWSLLVFFCILLTGSRISLFAQFILTMIYVYRSSTRKGLMLLRSAIIAGLLVSIVSFIPNPVSARSESVLSLDNLSTFKNLYDTLPVDTKFTGFADEDQPSNATTDLSWWMRVTKWTVVTKLYLNSSSMTRAIGIGPGAVGPALDGGWLRLLVECGLIGFVVFAMMLGRIASLSTACSMMVLALSINMLLIDSHIAYKVMAFLFFFAGYTFRRNSLASPGIASGTKPL